MATTRMSHLLTVLIEFYAAELRAVECQRRMYSPMIMSYMFSTRVAQDAGWPAPANRYSQKIGALDVDIAEFGRTIAILKKLKNGDQTN